jgi:hypothetical protein
MAEDTSVAQHLNEFNTITNQLSSVEIDFDNEIRTLIVLASLPNSWEAMRAAVSNYVGNSKLKYGDIQDLILGEEMCIRDFGEASCSGAALNIETRGRKQGRKSDRGRLGSKKVEANSGLVNNQNVGTMARLSTLRRIARNQGRSFGTTLQTW